MVIYSKIDKFVQSLAIIWWKAGLF